MRTFEYPARKVTKSQVNEVRCQRPLTSSGALESSIFATPEHFPTSSNDNTTKVSISMVVRIAACRLTLPINHRVRTLGTPRSTRNVRYRLSKVEGCKECRWSVYERAAIPAVASSDSTSAGSDAPVLMAGARNLNTRNTSCIAHKTATVVCTVVSLIRSQTIRVSTAYELYDQ